MNIGYPISRIKMYRHMHGWDEWRRYGFLGQKGWLLILMSLYDREMTGSDIMELVERESGGLSRLSPSLVYPYLKELKLSGFLDSEERDNKIYYKLSEKGKQLIEQVHSFHPGWRLIGFNDIDKFDIPTAINELENYTQFIVEKSEGSTLSDSQKDRIREIINKLSKLVK